MGLPDTFLYYLGNTCVVEVNPPLHLISHNLHYANARLSPKIAESRFKGTQLIKCYFNILIPSCFPFLTLLSAILFDVEKKKISFLTCVCDLSGNSYVNYFTVALRTANYCYQIVKCPCGTTIISVLLIC